MKSALFLVCVLMEVSLIGTGCSRKEDIAITLNPIKEPEKAISQLEQTYQAPDPATKSAISEIEQSLKAKDFEGATVGVQVLQINPNRTFEQSQVLNAMMQGLQREIAAGIDRGDPNAIKAAEALKRRR